MSSAGAGPKSGLEPITPHKNTNETQERRNTAAHTNGTQASALCTNKGVIGTVHQCRARRLNRNCARQRQAARHCNQSVLSQAPPRRVRSTQLPAAFTCVSCANVLGGVTKLSSSSYMPTPMIVFKNKKTLGAHTCWQTHQGHVQLLECRCKRRKAIDEIKNICKSH